MVKVILKQDLATVGDRGEVVDVRAGFARNYLIPQGYAYEATPGNLKRIEEEKRLFEERSKRDRLEAKRRASQFEGLSLTFAARASDDEEGKLFGSVTNADIADRINSQAKLDFELDRRWVMLDEPIKRLGEFKVPVRLHSDVEVEVDVKVERASE
jgi:large subunit ribosomal protein L9